MRLAAKDHARQERCRLALEMVAELGGTANARRHAARVFEVTERTIRRWQARKARGEPLVKRRGRPPTRVARDRRQNLIRAMIELGPHAGVPVLRGLFRDIPYRVIAALKTRFWRAWRKRRGWFQRKLSWLRPGSVWATDFTMPRTRLADGARRLMLVRDLASGMHLLAARCAGERAGVALAGLAVLFTALGAPLVLKHDNGGAFTAHSTQALLRAHGVTSLASPPYWPAYNGSCERSGGHLKSRASHLADLAGRGAHWSDADIETAMWMANHTARPRGARGATPAESFAERRRIDDEEREAFKQTCAKEAETALQTQFAECGTMPTCSELDAIRRQATQAALCDGGYMEIRRGRLSTPMCIWEADNKA